MESGRDTLRRRRRGRRLAPSDAGRCARPCAAHPSQMRWIRP